MKTWVWIVIAVIFAVGCGGGSGSQTQVNPVPPVTQPPATKTAVEAFKSRMSVLTPAEFFRQSFAELVLRDPEWALRQGLASELGLERPQFTPLSVEYRQQTLDFYQAALSRLHQFTESDLNSAQQVNRDVYAWWLDDQVKLMQFQQFGLSVMAVTRLEHFFLGLHPVQSKEDAIGYLSQLSALVTQYQAMIIHLKQRQTQGIVDPRVLIEFVAGGLSQSLKGTVEEEAIYRHFSTAVAKLNLGNNENERLTDRAGQMLLKSVRPAKGELLQLLEGLLPSAPTTEVGLSQYPNGRAYYEMVLAHHLTQAQSVAEVELLGSTELTLVQEKMKQAFTALGFASEMSLPELFKLLDEKQNKVAAKDVVSVFETLVTSAESRLSHDFHPFALPPVSVVGGHQDGYLPATRDGTLPGRFLANSSSDRFYYQMPSLAYHEGVPGHHMQLSVAQSLKLPLMRTLPLITVYVEGWALYVERLAYEQDWYNGQDVENLGRLQWEALRSARLLADIGINTKGWSWEQAVTFLSDNTGLPKESVSGVVARFVVNPGQATAYTYGMKKLLTLRERFKTTKAKDYKLADFHQRVLMAGPMPMGVLEKWVMSDSFE